MWRNGRRSGFKIRLSKERGSSSLPTGTRRPPRDSRPTRPIRTNRRTCLGLARRRRRRRRSPPDRPAVRARCRLVLRVPQLHPAVAGGGREVGIAGRRVIWMETIAVSRSEASPCFRRKSAQIRGFGPSHRHFFPSFATILPLFRGGPTGGRSRSRGRPTGPGPGRVGLAVEGSCLAPHRCRWAATRGLLAPSAVR